jgi:hypothetical protein
MHGQYNIKYINADVFCGGRIDIPGSNSYHTVGFGTGGIKPPASTAIYLFVLIGTKFVFLKSC